MPLGSVSASAMPLRRRRHRLQQEAVARRRQRRRDVDLEAVDDVAARDRLRRAVGEARQLVLAGRQRRVGRELVVARLQRLAVDDGDADARDARAAAVRRTRRPARRRPSRCSTTAAPSGAPIESSGAPAAAGVPRSRPSACCEFMAPAIAAASWPSRPRASGMSWFCTRSRPLDRAAGDEAVGEGARRAAVADADLHLRRIEGIGHGRRAPSRCRRARASASRRERRRPCRRRRRRSSRRPAATGC